VAIEAVGREIAGWRRGLEVADRALSGMEMHRLLPDVGAEASMQRNRAL